MLPTSGAVPGYEHIRFENLAFDATLHELQINLVNTTDQELLFSATLYFKDQNGTTLFRPHLRELLPPAQSTPCRIPLPTKRDSKAFQQIVDVRWDVLRENRTLVEVRSLVSVAEGDAGKGFLWKNLRFFGSDFGYEIRGNMVYGMGNKPLPKARFRVRLENAYHNVLLEHDVVLEDLRPGTEQDFRLQGTDITLQELRFLVFYRVSFHSAGP